MGCAQRPRPAELAAVEQAGHRLDHRDFQQLFGRQRRQQARRARGQHRLARAGRPDHQQIVPAGHGDLERALGGFLSAHIAQILHARTVDQLARRGARQRLAALEVIDQLDQRARRQDRQIAARPGRFRPARFGADEAAAAFGGQHRRGQGARARRDRAVQAQLAHRQIVLPGLGRQHAERDHQPDRDGQVVMGTLLGPVGRGEIDDQPLGGERQADGGEGGAYALAALGHGLVGEPDDVEGGLAAGDLDLDVGPARLRALERCRCRTPAHAILPFEFVH